MRKPNKKQPQVEETSRELEEKELEAVSGGRTATTRTSDDDYDPRVVH
jgi:bacteriocin-like protein